MGCTTKAVGDAVAWNDGYVIAFGRQAAASQQDGTCAPNATPTPELALTHVGIDASSLELASIHPGGELTDVSLAPHPDGAFVVYRTVDVTGRAELESFSFSPLSLLFAAAAPSGSLRMPIAEDWMRT